MPLILQLLIRINNCPWELAIIPKRLAGYISLHFGIFKGRTAARTERGGDQTHRSVGPPNQVVAVGRSWYQKIRH